MSNLIRIYEIDGSFIDREMTSEELAEWQVNENAIAAKQKQILEKQQARQAVLEKLGLTEEEAKVLLG